MFDEKQLLQNLITTSDKSNIIAFKTLSCSFLFSLSNKLKSPVNDIESNTIDLKLTIYDETENLINIIDRSNVLDDILFNITGFVAHASAQSLVSQNSS